MKKNLVWINLIKGFCILLVYLNHSEIFYGISTDWFIRLYQPFFVNLFFIISGYLLFKKYVYIDKCQKFNTGGYLKNILFRIIIPSIIFTTIIFFPKQIIRGQDIEIQKFLNDTIGGCSAWFTSAFAIAQLLLVIFFKYKCSKISIYIIYGFILTIIANYLTISGFDINYYYFKSGMIATLFISIGGLYFKYEDKISRVLQNKWSLIINSLFLILYVYITTKTNILLSSVNSGFVNVAGVIFATYISINIILLIKQLPDIPVVSFIGKNSIVFYFLSGAIPNVIAIIAQHVLPVSLIGLLVVCVLSVILAYAAVYIITLYFPWLTDVRLIKSKKDKFI